MGFINNQIRNHTDLLYFIYFNKLTKVRHVFFIVTPLSHLFYISKDIVLLQKLF
jgi:hypothetical protein